MHTLITQCAEQLRNAEASGVPCAPIRERIAQAAQESNSDSIAVAYRIQQLNIDQKVANGARVVGRKIGLTSKVVQTQLGVDQPDFGTLLDSMSAGDGEEIDFARTFQPKIEAEIALVLERDLTHERHNFADLIRSVAFALPALEIVGSRIANWDIKLADTVADNASSSMFVLGARPVMLHQFDPAACPMEMTRNNVQSSTGNGRACLGNPLNAAIWLADVMNRLGQPLRAGDVILTGALGAMVPVARGDSFAAQIVGLGSVSVSFSK